jgi:SAM-dependent methyltransferase
MYVLNRVADETYPVVCCNDCGTHFLHPEPSESVLKDSYSEKYHGTREKKFVGFIQQIRISEVNRRYKLCKKRLPENGKMLDIGCGEGLFIEKFNFHGVDVLGIEVSDIADQRSSKKGLRVIKDTFEKIDLKGEKFDLISLIHVFEHLSQPFEVLDKIGKHNNPGGQLLIVIPNITSWQASMFKGSWFHWDPPRHLFLCTPNALIEKMASLDYELVHEKHQSLEMNPFGLFQSILNFLGFKRDSFYLLIKNSKNTNKLSFLGMFSYLMLLIFIPFLILEDFVSSIFKRSATIELLFVKK